MCVCVCVCVCACNFWPHSATCGILVHWPGIEPVPLALEGRVLTTGPPTKSPVCILNTENNWISLPASFKNPRFCSEDAFSLVQSCEHFWALTVFWALCCTPRGADTAASCRGPCTGRSQDLGGEPRHIQHKADWSTHHKWEMEKRLREHRICNQCWPDPRRAGRCTSEPGPPLRGFLTPTLAAQEPTTPTFCPRGRSFLPDTCCPCLFLQASFPAPPQAPKDGSLHWVHLLYLLLP